jgi:[CysO sulfur-carrier protein]-S-L-cysteine hydrolase
MPEPRAGVRAQVSEPAATGSDARVPEVSDWQRAADVGHERRTGVSESPLSATLTVALRDEVIAWSIGGRPNEACGLIAGTGPALDGGVPTRFLPLTNAAASPYRYLIDPDEQLRAMLDIDDADEMIWGIVHSHVMSPAVPSDTDVGLAAYPDALYLICSLAGDQPQVRAWAIRDGAVDEVGLHAP